MLCFPDKGGSNQGLTPSLSMKMHANMNWLLDRITTQQQHGHNQVSSRGDTNSQRQINWKPNITPHPPVGTFCAVDPPVHDFFPPQTTRPRTMFSLQNDFSTYPQTPSKRLVVPPPKHVSSPTWSFEVLALSFQGLRDGLLGLRFHVPIPGFRFLGLVLSSRLTAQPSPTHSTS